MPPEQEDDPPEQEEKTPEQEVHRRSQEGKGRQPYRAARIAFWHFAGLRKRIGSDGLAARAAAVCARPSLRLLAALEALLLIKGAAQTHAALFRGAP